jgi:uncharacterized protein (UPF0332 family)/ElaB/YqjD/DUF883 family membrane-anchored ribosome-binding protein
MNNRRILRLPALMALFAVAACDNVGTDLGLEDLTPEQQLELSVLEDQGSFDAAIIMSSVTTDVATTRGNSGAAEAQSLRAQAEAAFAEARAAHTAGDDQRAIEASRLARRLVARALIATGGVPAVEDLLERLEALLLTMDAEVVDDPAALRAELETILAEARALLEAGDSVAAAAHAILGEQRVRLRRGRHLRDFEITERRARLEVGLARSAVGLAERLLASDFGSDVIVGDVVVTDVATDAPVTDRAKRHDRWFAHAQKWLEKAETALANGRYARAVHFAWHAQWAALKAVILPGGITEQEIRAMIGLANELFDQAEAAIGDDGTELEIRLLNRAADLIEIGIRKIENGQKRGVAALWRASTMSAWLLG